MRKRSIMGIHGDPGRWKYMLGCIPFVALVVAYLVFSWLRHAKNPDDRLLPIVSKIVVSMGELMNFSAIGQYYRGEIDFAQMWDSMVFWSDTAMSLFRITVSMSSAAVVGLWLGLHLGLFRTFRAIWLPFVTFLSLIPPLSLLPILFIVLGVEETAKITLIFIGSVLVITRSIYLATSAIPIEQTVTALTLGASQGAIVYCTALPQVMPCLINAVRISLGGAWLFLIAAEMIAATSGLGYRIGLVRRYMSMDVIIPYVFWIAFLGFVMDRGLRAVLDICFPWFQSEQK